MRNAHRMGLLVTALVALLALPSVGMAQAPMGTTAAPAAKAAKPPAKKAMLASNQFTKEADAKAHCPGDTVVWANLSSKIYHYSDNKNYGKGKSGAYMCEKETAADKIRPAKNEKHP